MTQLSPERIKQTALQYSRAVEEAEEIMVQAMCETYHAITGGKASDRLREALADAIRFNL